MNDVQFVIDNWPKNRAGEPILKHAGDAALYGTLISNHPEHIEALKAMRQKAYHYIAIEKRTNNVSVQRMINLATKAQLFREAYEEAERIRAETLEQVWRPSDEIKKGEGHED